MKWDKLFTVKKKNRKYRVLKQKIEKNKGLSSRKVDHSKGSKEIWWCRVKLSLPWWRVKRPIENCSFKKKIGPIEYLVERSIKMGLFFLICDCGGRSNIGKVDGRRLYGGYFKSHHFSRSLFLLKWRESAKGRRVLLITCVRVDEKWILSFGLIHGSLEVFIVWEFSFGFGD
jgi:hypothetical protein